MSVRGLALCLALLGLPGSKHEPKDLSSRDSRDPVSCRPRSRSMSATPSCGRTTTYCHIRSRSGIPAPSAFDSKEIAAKAQWTLTVTASGEYDYACTYHPTMLGKLVAR